MRAWDEVLTEQDKQVFAAAGYGQPSGFGARPALLVIDVNYAFVGLRAPILESIQTWPQSAGATAWQAVDALVDLLRTARERSVPVIYTTNQSGGAARAARTRRKVPQRRQQLSPDQVERGRRIVEEVAPVDGEAVVEKPHASAFAGTCLHAILVGLQVDTLLIAGGTVSGCVRASAVDAAALNYYVAVIEDATFDRAQASRLASLFDLDAKYADVVACAAATRYLQGLATTSGTPDYAGRRES